MPKIEIDGIEVEADAGAMIIQVADKMDIPIPRFCYHNKLSIAANCRMCLVHVDKAPKALPACATPITEGMKVWTKSKTAVDAQKSVMEFLLINHPLDCPICDQGGECELQDVSMDYGRDVSRFTEQKRVVVDKNLGPLIATDMTRCIQCTRCVRFGAEVAGFRELGATGRTEYMEITTFIEQNVTSEVSGNIIDLCPVGALTSKPFRFRARAWELDQFATIASHDCVGSNVYAHVRNNVVMRIVPKHCEEINEVWLADRDRFSYEALLHEDRLRKPLMRKTHKMQIVSWVEALKYATAGIDLVIKNYGAEQLGVLASPNATLEEFYLLQLVTRSLGSPNIDHRLRQQDFSAQEHAPLYPNLGIRLKDIENLDCLFIIGMHVHKEQPIAALRIRKLAKKGAKVCMLNTVHFAANFPVAADICATAGDLLGPLAGIAKAVLTLKNIADEPAVHKLLANIQSTTAEQQIAELLVQSPKTHLILGMEAQMHPHASQLQLLATYIAAVTGATCGVFSDGANAAGAWLAGCVPHREVGGKIASKIGKNALEMLQEPLKCYVLYNIEPDFDSVLGQHALESIAAADFVVVISAYQSDALLEFADVFLPIAAFTENQGTIINCEGTWQTTNAIVHPFGDSRPGWKVLRVLGNLAGLTGFNQDNLDEVTNAIKTQLQPTPVFPMWHLALPDRLDLNTLSGIIRIAPIPLYAVDNVVRRAAALQATEDAINQPTVHMNSNTAKHLQVSAGKTIHVKSPYGKVKLAVTIDESIGERAVLIYQATMSTNYLGLPFSVVELSV